MNNEEAKFILSGYRPGGSDAQDPAFTEALAQAERDPELKRWFERSCTFDAKIAASLKSVAPPEGLREAILAGGRVSFGRTPSQSHWTRWLAMAAVLVIGIGLAGLWQHNRHRGESESALARFALADVNRGGHIGDPDSASRAALEADTGPLDSSALPVDFARMEKDGCRTLHLGGRRVIEVCFARSGIMYHLYFMQRASDDVPNSKELPAQWESEGAAAAAWTTSQYIVALATHGPAAALQRLL
ncbi:MAG TPA: hypothetical protein VGL42_00060 [Opitutaceae bacterium]|jgi:hypothetical protein